jgi:large subunit ribosomal protein L15
MYLSNLKPAKGSIKKSKRVGRGQGSGKGGTSTRGTKGGQSRAGHKNKMGFEGGQMPIQRRVPKFGFKNPNRKEYTPINLLKLQQIFDQHQINKFTPEVFVEYGIASKHSIIKILAKGELTATLEVTAHAFSKSAITAIEQIGGKAIKI